VDSELNAKPEAAFYEAVTLKGDVEPLKFSPDNCRTKGGRAAAMTIRMPFMPIKSRLIQNKWKKF